eukprot:scaffold89951_cov48-Phaeocystis_antarctica.AAC.5
MASCPPISDTRAAFAAGLAPVRPSVRSSSAGSAPLSSAAARVAQPASVTRVALRPSVLSFSSTPVVGGSTAAGGSGVTRAARPSSPNGLLRRRSSSSAGSRCKAGARATSPASPMAALPRLKYLSRGRAPRPMEAASAEAPVLPTCKPKMTKFDTAGSAPAPSPAASRCTPSGLVAAAEPSSVSCSSAGSTEPSVPSSPRLVGERPLS